MGEFDFLGTSTNDRDEQIARAAWIKELMDIIMRERLKRYPFDKRSKMMAQLFGARPCDDDLVEWLEVLAVDQWAVDAVLLRLNVIDPVLDRLTGLADRVAGWLGRWVGVS